MKRGLAACAALALCASLAFGSVGCTNMNKTQQGVLSGGAAGALAGAGLSAIAGGSGTIGALIGGGLGAVAGGIYGHEKSK
ncbi:MAG: cell envelope biogenesis protein OmpA [Mailhella sp.]|nr:cell envelope biogenesis protein OmpA [Mailhella sp.]